MEWGRVGLWWYNCEFSVIPLPAHTPTRAGLSVGQGMDRVGYGWGWLVLTNNRTGKYSQNLLKPNMYTLFPTSIVPIDAGT